MNLESPETENTAEQEYELAPNEPYPIVISPLHFTLLCIATMGMYSIWWQYKCWVYFKEKEKSGIIPALYALSFIFLALPVIPLLNKIADYCRLYKHKVMYNSIVAWLACLAINYGGYLFKTTHPAIWGLLGILIFVPLIPAVMEFNFYFTANRNGYKGDKLNNRQIVLLVIGGFLWATVINAILTGNFPPADPFK
jgi:hypothetical protein